MSFFDRARAGYEHLAGRADQALDSATAGRDLGEIDRYYRDLGMLAYLDATGRSVDPGAREALVVALQAMEGRGAIRDFTLATQPDAPTGPPPPQRHGGSDGVPTPPPERAGRHGHFLGQQRGATPAPPGGPSGETTGPRPTPPPPPPPAGGTWGPPT